MDAVSFAEFKKLDLRIGEVVEVLEVESLDKVLKLRVDLGELGIKTILAGVKETHSKEDLVRKQIVVVANLAPKKIGGEVSEGMLLAVDTDKEPVLLTPNRKVAVGAKVV
ncbi:MAG: methionine--tRNA ligase [Patescibacteria group bacterium]